MNPSESIPLPRSRMLTVVLFCLGYFSYFLCKVFFVLVVAPFLWLLVPWPKQRYRFLDLTLRGFMTAFTRSWLPALGIYEIVEISGLERALTLSPAVLAANHRGFMDSPLLLSLVPRLGVVIKARRARGLTYFVLMRTFDLVSIDPGRLSSVGAALAAGERVLAAGRRLLVYPEGVRARSGQLRPFHPLAFELACRARVPVIPVLIHSTVPFLAKVPGSIFPRQRNHFRIRFLEPEALLPNDTAESLGDRVRGRMARELKALDAGTYWAGRSPKLT
jgi:1-acyl-sn-glycerol-3-phosphate acyltransferase